MSKEKQKLNNIIYKNFTENIVKIQKKSDYDNKILEMMITKNLERIETMKEYIKQGYDLNVNVTGDRIPWLFEAIRYNDIPMMGLLLKHGANPNQLIFDNINIIFFCVLSKNTVLLDYFLKKGINSNHLTSDKNTPLLLSCLKESYAECAKILLNHNETQIEVKGQAFETIEMIIRNAKTGNPVFLELLKIVLRKKKKLDTIDISHVYELVRENNLEILKIYLSKFPSLINKINDDTCRDTIVYYAIYLKRKDILQYIFTFKNLDTNKKNNNGRSYLYYLLLYELIDELKIYCIQYPKSIKNANNNGNLIEDIIDHMDMITDYNVIKKTIKVLCENGADINSKNSKGYSVVFSAIQYLEYEMIKYLIDNGLDITLLSVGKNEYPPKENNDIIGFTIQVNKIDILKLLLENGSILHKIIINNTETYTSLLLCLIYNRYDILVYLMEINEIKEYFEKNILTVNNFMFDYAIKNGCTNTNILKLFTTENKINLIDFKETTYKLKLFEKKLCLLMPKYNNAYNKQYFLEGLNDILNIIYNLINATLKSKKKIELYCNQLFENMIVKDKEEDNVDYSFTEFIDVLLIVVSHMIDSHDLINFKTSIDTAFDLYFKLTSDDECDDETPRSLINKINTLSKKYANCKEEIMNLKEISKLCLEKHKNEDINNNVVKYKKYKECNYVVKALFKLYWPIKQPHYEYVFNNLMNNQDTIIKHNDNEDLIILSSDKVKTIIFRNYNTEQKKPTQWIKTYAPNIGKYNKSDANHRFSFLLDKILEGFNCIEKQVFDPIHKEGMNSLLYFYGVIEHNGHIETGCYEYFINSNGTLFHRMFRPYINLPITVSSLLDK